MEKAKTFQELDAWKTARGLVGEVYRESSGGPLAKDFVLKDQMRRAALSVMSNIAEGFERDGNREFLQFLSIAKGSTGELKSHLVVAMDLGYIEANRGAFLIGLSENVGRQLGGMLKYLRESVFKGKKFPRSGDSPSKFDKGPTSGGFIRNPESGIRNNK